MPRAPRPCSANGCPNTIRGDMRRCPDHQSPSWSGPRTRSSTITSTAAWKQLRQQVLQRDRYQCQIRFTDVCIGHATHVDHIINTAAGGAELDATNCQAACPPCNARKASAEGASARRLNPKRSIKRPPEQHPGLRH